MSHTTIKVTGWRGSRLRLAIGTDVLPVFSTKTVNVQFPDGAYGDIYLVELAGLTGAQREALAEMFISVGYSSDSPEETFDYWRALGGMPVKAQGCIVQYFTPMAFYN